MLRARGASRATQPRHHRSASSTAPCGSRGSRGGAKLAVMPTGKIQIPTEERASGSKAARCSHYEPRRPQHVSPPCVCPRHGNTFGMAGIARSSHAPWHWPSRPSRHLKTRPAIIYHWPAPCSHARQVDTPASGSGKTDAEITTEKYGLEAGLVKVGWAGRSTWRSHQPGPSGGYQAAGGSSWRLRTGARLLRQLDSKVAAEVAVATDANAFDA